MLTIIYFQTSNEVKMTPKTTDEIKYRKPCSSILVASVENSIKWLGSS